MRSRIWLAALALSLAAAGCADKRSTKSSPQPAAQKVKPRPTAPLEKDQVKRLKPKQVEAKVKAGGLLVCAYDSDEKFARVALQGAISRSGFRKVQKSTPKDTPLIFYCA